MKDEGECPGVSDTELYGETHEKDSWGERSLWPILRFRRHVPGSPVTGKVVASTNFDGKPVNQDL